MNITDYVVFEQYDVHALDENTSFVSVSGASKSTENRFKLEMVVEHVDAEMLAQTVAMEVLMAISEDTVCEFQDSKEILDKDIQKALDMGVIYGQST